MKLATRLSVLVLLGALAACSRQRTAEQAVDAAASALGAIQAEVIKYRPGEYEDVQTELDGAREALQAGRYADAITAARTVSARTTWLAAHVADARKDFAATLATEWEQLNGAVPAMVAAVEARLAGLRSGAGLPQGIDETLVSDATVRLATARQHWGTAAQKFAAGDLEQAVAHATATRTITTILMRRLGLDGPAELPAGADGA